MKLQADDKFFGSVSLCVSFGNGWELPVTSRRIAHASAGDVTEDGYTLRLAKQGASRPRSTTGAV